MTATPCRVAGVEALSFIMPTDLCAHALTYFYLLYLHRITIVFGDWPVI